MFPLPQVTSVNLVGIWSVAAGGSEPVGRGGFGLTLCRVAFDGSLDCAAVRRARVKPCAFGAPLGGCGA